jgi:hypothetical protein
MSNKSNESRLRDFVAEIEQLDLPAFVATDRWCLLEDILNGVRIGYTLASLSDRKILHDIGQKYRLIPLCPGDVVDVEMCGGCMTVVVRTPFGTLPLRRPGLRMAGSQE